MREMTEEEIKRIEQSWKSEVDLKLDRVDSRVRIIERLVWIATGGVIVLAGISVFGVSMLLAFSTRLEAVSSAQAVSAAELKIYYLRAEEMRRQLDELRETRRR